MLMVSSPWTILLLLLLLLWFQASTHGRSVTRISEDLCIRHSSSFVSSIDPQHVSNVVILSATGRVGSSNLLSMLGSHPHIDDLGEIFIAARFRSQKLPPNINSPKKAPASSTQKQRIATHIRKSFSSGQHVHNSRNEKSSLSSTIHRLASVKFWHAWENGVSVSWMVRHLQSCGLVSHFILIARNPVRITISEQYANRFHSWVYRTEKNVDKNSRRAPKRSVCEKSMFSHHVGGRWLGEMVVDHYTGFHDAVMVISSKNSTPFVINPLDLILGLSYEADILKDSRVAYQKVADFLNLTKDIEYNLPTAKHRKGMTCPLSMLLINYEELRCSLHRWDHMGGRELDDGDGLMWMSADVDRTDLSFERIMHSWRTLYEQLGQEENSYISECSLRDIVQLEKKESGLDSDAKLSLESWRMAQDMGTCGVGGETSTCRGISAVPGDRPELCLLTGKRAGCDGMTFKDRRCYLHKHISDFRTERCDAKSWYMSVK